MTDFDSLDPRDLEALYGLRPEKPRRKKWARRARYTAVVLLAVACVGGMELLACRHFEPEIYNAIMEPVRRTARQTVRIGAAAWNGVCRAGEAAANRAGEAAAALSERAGEARDSFQAWLEEVTAPPPEPAVPLAEDSTLAQPEIAPPKDLLNPLISDLVEREDGMYLTGGSMDVLYFDQTDESRAEQKYGSDLLSTHGCGPTAMAMAVSTLTGEPTGPEEMAQLCVNQGYWCKGHGSYLSIVQGVAESYGLRCEPADLTDKETLYARLTSGEMGVALMTKGHFTRGGHFILLRGTTLSGEILVADPASQDRSLIPWDLDLILGELSPSRHDGAPLWMLSRTD
ncbi:C39 family peptidase [Oscillospiraceae bacterium 38-13]